jgi:hypothetical protein
MYGIGIHRYKIPLRHIPRYHAADSYATITPPSLGDWFYGPATILRIPKRPRPNLVKAFERANDHGLETAAIVGAKRGRLAEVARQTIVVADTHYGRVEDVQMNILHMLCDAFMEG